MGGAHSFPRLRASLLLGALLLCAHCSLRFGDIQRIKPSALSLSAQALRGLCWATKTTCQGQPFACLPFGFRGEDISTSWLVKWLALLSQALDATYAEWGDSFVPDFILPCIPNLESHACPSLSRPMSYLQALVCLRWAIQLPWKSEGGQLVTQHEASSFTLHSLNCALLSAAAQLRLPEDSRRLQGHHRLSSALLYSRDDTIEALWVQSELTAAIRRGWRPPRPMARNQPFRFHRAALQAICSLRASHLVTRFLYHREVDNLLSTALDADEEALAVARAALESSEAESEEEPPDEQACSPDPPPCTQASPSALAIDSIGIRLVPWGSVHAVQCTHGISVQTACGLHLKPSLKHCSYPVHQIHPDMQLCKRKACMAALC